MLVFTLKDEFGKYSKEIKMEHSLRAIAEWESVFKIPLLTIERFDGTEFLFYLSCMCVDCELTPQDLELMLTQPAYVKLIEQYMNDSRTATYVKSMGDKSNIILTSEVLYAYMTLQEIDWSAEDWHITRLLKLLEVIAELTKEKKPMSQEEIAAERIRLNNERRKKYKSKG